MIVVTRNLVALFFLALSSSAFLIVPQSSRCLNRIVSASSSVLSSEADVTPVESKPEIDISEEDAAQNRKVERERYTVFVGNLPFDTTNQQIKALFEQYGTVDLIALPKKKDTDQPRGFAFVDMSSSEELEAAIAGVDGFMLGNRKLRAMKSTPQEEREKPTENKRKREDSQGSDNSRKIYVGNIKFDTTKDDLIGLFEQYGSVSEVYIPFNSQTGQGRGFAFVSMTEEDTEKAIEATNGMVFQGRTLVVNKPHAPGEKAPVRRNDRDRKTKLYIGNLSFYTVGETLKEIFEEFGQVYDCYLPEDPTTGGTRGFGFITMARDDALNAISELDGCEVDGRVIRVNEAKPKGRSGSISIANDDAFDPDIDSSYDSNDGI